MVNKMDEMKNVYAFDEDEVCTEVCVHSEIVCEIKAQMPSEEEMFALAELYKVFGDHTRIRILCVLWEREVCVCDIAELLGMTQSAISHQLRVLKQARLVKSKRQGKTVFYSLADEHVCTVINSALEHVKE